MSSEFWIEALRAAESIITFALGASVGIVVERIRRREERDAENRRLRRARIIEPIEAFVDKQLELISGSYWASTTTIVESKRWDEEIKEVASQAGADAVRDEMNLIQRREGAVAARVKALKDPVLAEAFRKLSFQFFNMRGAAMKGGFGAAHEEREKAIALAVEVLEALWAEPSKKK